MSWIEILKRKTGLVVPLARECMIAWSIEAEIGTKVSFGKLREPINDCYLEKLPAWIAENFEGLESDSSGDPIEKKLRLYTNFWSGTGNKVRNFENTLANILMQNMDIRSNHWVRRSTKFAQGYLPSQSTTTIYVKVEAL